MPTKQADKGNSVATGTPSTEEIVAVHRSILPARIERRDLVIPPELAATILGPDGSPVAPDRLFPFLARPSNSLPDFYSTYQTIPPLENYAEDGKEGVSLMLAHDTSDMPIGRSYDAWVEIDQVTTLAERAAAIAKRGGARLALPMGVEDPLAWLFVNFFMLRGLDIGKKSNDNVIAGILSGTLKDVSITFIAEALRCNICHMDIYDWDCPHIPGVEYDLGDLGNFVCLAAVEGGHMIEVSLVYKGATPGAVVTEVKARMVAAAQRLTSGEARQLGAIEARIGQRLVDPSYMRRALGASVSVPSLPRPANAAGTQNKERSMSVKTTAKPASARRDTTTPPATDTTTASSDLEQVVADQATSDAQAIADQISSTNTLIAASEATIQSLNDQIAAAQNAVDASGAPIDNTDAIAALQSQLDAENQNLAGLQAQLDALNAELDGVNQTADATGGTTTDAPAADAGAAPPAAQANAIRTARAALGQMQAILRNHVAPIRGRRDITADQLTPIATAAQQLADDINALLTDMGADAARSVADSVVFGTLRRATGVQKPGIVQVRQLVREAEAGRQYLKDLQEACVTERVRAVGAEHANVEQYRRMISQLDVAGLQAELGAQSVSARSNFTPGRRVLPTNGTGSIDVPANAGSNGADGGGSGSTNPVPFSN